MSRQSRAIVSLFSGAMGLDLGMEAAGFDVRVAVECNRFAAQTIATNRPDIALIDRRIEDVTAKEILRAGGLSRADVAVVVGGPCCQSFSTAGQRASVSEPRGTLFQHFLRIVTEIRPRFFVMENVRGMLSAAVRHRPLSERGHGFPPLSPDEELGSAFAVMLRAIKQTGYHVVFDVLNAADFGVPQRRDRLVLIGSRDGERVAMPSPTHAEKAHDGRRPWATFQSAVWDLRYATHTFRDLPPSKARVMIHVPEGGNWRDLPVRMQRAALGSAFTSWGGRCGFFRRLSWDRPSPALTTRPDSTATLLCHPEELRALSVEEFARVQQFPDGWRFAGGMPQQYAQIGNAVPVGLGRAVGEAIRATMRRRTRMTTAPAIVCASASLFTSLTGRARTVLNPPRMRNDKSRAAARAWTRAGSTGLEGRAIRGSALGKLLVTG